MTRQVLLGIALVVAVGAAALLTGGGADSGDTPAAPTAPAGDGDVSTGRPAMLDTTFEHFDGSVVRLADWAGTPMVVNFWASWCPPCVAEMSAAFEPVHADVGDQVAFIGLNLEDDPDAAAEIVERTGVTYDLGRDPVGELFTAFGGIGMPTTVFIDGSGQIVDTHTGALSRAQLERAIEQAFGVAA
ncbi:MAG: TlpA disulfide reductase family protein [Egibacteraceae bacterium]